MSYEAFRLMVQGWASAGYLPEALAYGFVVNALLAGLLIGPVLGGLGTLVVVKRFAFFSEAVGHAALTGVAVGILLGEPYTGPYGSLFGYCLLFGILLNYLRNRTGLAPDTLIGVFLSVSLALGASLLLILAGKINVHILENVLLLDADARVSQQPVQLGQVQKDRWIVTGALSLQPVLRAFRGSSDKKPDPASDQI